MDQHNKDKDCWLNEEVSDGLFRFEVRRLNSKKFGYSEKSNQKTENEKEKPEEEIETAWVGIVVEECPRQGDRKYMHEPTRRLPEYTKKLTGAWSTVIQNNMIS